MKEETGNTVHSLRLAEIEPVESNGRNLTAGNLDLIRNVKVKLTVSAGSCQIAVKELFALKENGVIELDKATSDPVEVLLDDRVVARGNLVAVGDSFGVQISEILQH
jgi:flagellar motor switch protein FliN